MGVRTEITFIALTHSFVSTFEITTLHVGMDKVVKLKTLGKLVEANLTCKIYS